MAENDDEKESKLEKELHTEIDKNVIQKNDKGTYNLNDAKTMRHLKSLNETDADVDDKIKHLKQLLMHDDMGREVKTEIMRRMKELQAEKTNAQKPKQKRRADRDPNSFVNVPTHNLYDSKGNKVRKSKRNRI
jgi:signal recognition particle GTPase